MLSGVLVFLCTSSHGDNKMKSRNQPFSNITKSVAVSIKPKLQKILKIKLRINYEYSSEFSK